MGRQVGRYQIEGEIGRGGMGVVFKARDTELGRLVALKSLPAERGESPDRRRRFLQEARAASALNHPNIIAVHDILAADGADWIVMEFVAGRSLRELIPSEGLPVAQATIWAREIADALSTAHRAGIIHRDLKPGNVMIDEAGRSRVLDFGLAKLHEVDLPSAGDPTVTPAAPLTQAGVVLGTPKYMSPEQAMGRPVDARSDIFSFGIVLYEMLTGQAPFEAENLPSIIHAVAFEAQRAPESLRREIPVGLAELVDRCLEKDPADRFQSMDEVRNGLLALENTVETRPAKWSRSALQIGRKRSSAPKLREPGRRRALWLGALAVIAVALVAFYGMFRRSSPPATKAQTQDTAVSTPLPETPFQLYKAGDDLLTHYWRAGYIDRALEAMQRAVDLDPSYAPAYAGLATASQRKYDATRDKVWLDRAKAQAEHALQLDASLTAARLRLGSVQAARGDLAQAEEELQQVERLDPANAEVYRRLADVAAARDHRPEAEVLYRKAIEHAPDDPELYSALGSFLFGLSRYDDAARAFEKSTGIASDFVFGYRNAAAAEHMLGHYDRAAEQLQRAIEIQPDAASYSNLGTLYFFQAIYPQALAAYKRAIELGANDYVIWSNLGDAYRFTPGHEADARRAYTRALQLLDEANGGAKDDPTTASRRALLLAKKGDHDQAVELSHNLAAKLSDPTALYRCALAFELSGRRHDALAALRRALERGYSASEISQDPELTRLRQDPEYQLMMADLGASK